MVNRVSVALDRTLSNKYMYCPITFMTVCELDHIHDKPQPSHLHVTIKLNCCQTQYSACSIHSSDYNLYNFYFYNLQIFKEDCGAWNYFSQVF